MEEEAVLIDIIQHYSFLYDKTKSNYKDASKKELAWQTISEAMQRPVEEVQRLWRLLRDRYSKERRITKTTPSGSAAKESQWQFYKAMGFMEKHVTTRKRTTNIKPIDIIKKKRAVDSPQSVGSSEDSNHPWDSFNQIISHDLSEIEEHLEETSNDANNPPNVAEAEIPLPGPSHQSELRETRFKPRDVQVHVQETLSALTNYLQGGRTKK